MQAELKTVLKDYLDKLQHTTAQVHKSRKSAAPSSIAAAMVNLTEEELSGWATGPAGGAQAIQIPAAGAAPAAGTGEERPCGPEAGGGNGTPA